MHRHHFMENSLQSRAKLLPLGMATPSMLWPIDVENGSCVHCTPDGIQTRVVWITNYITDENFPINVPTVDSTAGLVEMSAYATEPVHEVHPSQLNSFQNVDLSAYRLDELLLLLHRLQQRTTQNAVGTSLSTMSSPCMSTADSIGSYVLQPSHRTSTAIHRQKSSFTLSNIADAPKQLTVTLAKSPYPYPPSHSKHIHSPNDVVNKLVQSFHAPRNARHPKFGRYASERRSLKCTYQESQQHKAKLLSTLLASHPVGCFPPRIRPDQLSY